MSLAACLLTYSLVIAVLGPPLLSRATRSGAAPRLGITAWVAAMTSVLAAWAGAAALLIVELVTARGQVDHLLTGCFATLQVVGRGGYGAFLQVGLVVLAVLAALAVGVLTGRLVWALRRAYTSTRQHAQAARLAAAGAPPGPQGALVIDTDQRGVYCLAGRPPTIVITRAALAALDDAQLAAVLAHERAHLIGHHHHLLALARALAKILPGMRLVTVGATDIARLVEMSADDAAARLHGPDTVVDALLALSRPAGTATEIPALGAVGVGVAQRVERLLFPPDRTRARLTLGLTLGALLLGPVCTAALLITGPAL